MTELQLVVPPAGSSITDITHLSVLGLLGEPDKQGEVAQGGNEHRCRGKTPQRHSTRSGGREPRALGVLGKGSFSSRLFLRKLCLDFLSVLHPSILSNTHLAVAPAAVRSHKPSSPS